MVNRICTTGLALALCALVTGAAAHTVHVVPLPGDESSSPNQKVKPEGFVEKSNPSARAASLPRVESGSPNQKVTSGTDASPEGRRVRATP